MRHANTGKAEVSDGLFGDELEVPLRDLDESVVAAELCLRAEDLDEALEDIEQAKVVTQEIMQLEISV